MTDPIAWFFGGKEEHESPSASEKLEKNFFQ
jgi:hypothetical protein